MYFIKNPVDPHIKALFLNIMQFISLFYDKDCRTSRLFCVKKFLLLVKRILIFFPIIPPPPLTVVPATCYYGYLES